MLVLPSNPVNKGLSLRPVSKGSDRPVIHQIFLQEFYGNNPRSYSDTGLWEIYDRMETRGIYGAYLVCQDEHVRFLLEIHPPEMVYLAEYSFQEHDISIYCFFLSVNETIDLPAVRACLDILLNYPDVGRIITSFGSSGPDESRAILLQKAGFVLRPESTERLSIYECTRETFPGL